MSLRLKSLILTFLFVVGCGVGGSDGEQQNQLFCEVSQEDTYTVGVDPTVDFDVTNIPRKTEFSNVTCPGVSSTTVNTTLSRLKRVSARLIFVNASNITGLPFQLNILDNEISAQVFYNYLSNCTVQTLMSGTIDSGTNTIVVSQTSQYNGDCSDLF